MSLAVAERSADGAIILPNLSALTDEQLEAEFAGALKDTADGLLRLAAATAELERRGRDLSHLKLHLLSYLRLIAARQLLPDVVLYLGDQKKKVMAIAGLPIPKQRALLDADQVHVLVNGEDCVVSLRELHPRHFSQVFGETRIRTIAEQRAFIREQKTTKRPKLEPQGNVRADHERKGIKIRNSFGPLAEVQMAVAEFAGPLLDLDIETAETMSFRGTADEKQAIRVKAGKLGMTPEYYIRKLLHGAGAFV